MAMVADSVGLKDVGAAIGFAVGVAQLTIVISAPAYGLMADQLHTYRAVWAVLAGVLMLSVIPIVLLRGRAGGGG